MIDADASTWALTANWGGSPQPLICRSDGGERLVSCDTTRLAQRSPNLTCFAGLSA
jgi:hypothetical protein